MGRPPLGGTECEGVVSHETGFQSHPGCPQQGMSLSTRPRGRCACGHQAALLLSHSACCPTGQRGRVSSVSHPPTLPGWSSTAAAERPACQEQRLTLSPVMVPLLRGLPAIWTWIDDTGPLLSGKRVTCCSTGVDAYAGYEFVFPGLHDAANITIHVSADASTKDARLFYKQGVEGAMWPLELCATLTQPAKRGLLPWLGEADCHREIGVLLHAEGKEEHVWNAEGLQAASYYSLVLRGKGNHQQKERTSY